MTRHAAGGGAARGEKTSMLRQLVGLTLGVVLIASAPAGSAEIVPHRASYTLSLGQSKSSGGVIDIQGAMYIEWQ